MQNLILKLLREELNKNNKVIGLHFTIKKDKSKNVDKFEKEFDNYINKNKIGYCDGHGAGIGDDTYDVFNYVNKKLYNKILEFAKTKIKEYGIESEIKLRKGIEEIGNDIDSKYIDF